MKKIILAILILVSFTYSFSLTETFTCGSAEIKANILQMPWLTFNFSTNSKFLFPKVNVTSNVTFYDFSCKSKSYMVFQAPQNEIPNFTLIYKTNSFPFPVKVTVEIYNNSKLLCTKVFNLNIYKPKVVQTQNLETCPGNLVDLSLYFNFDDARYYPKARQIIYVNVKNGSNWISSPILVSPTTVSNVLLPNNLETRYVIYLKCLNNEVYNYSSGVISFNTPPLVGVESYSILHRSVKLNCYDQRGLPVPCDSSYIIKSTLSNDNIPINYSVLLKVKYPDKTIDTYSRLVTPSSTEVSFGFDGNTSDDCNYTLTSDINCTQIPLLNAFICYSKSSGEAFLSNSKICVRSLDFTAKCPAPTIQKRWKDVEVEALPMHFTFGVNLSEIPLSNNSKVSEGTQLLRLNGGKVESYGTTVYMKVFRYYYNWVLEGVNWTIQVLSNKNYVPVRVGYNQINSTTCGGDSVCYTKVPVCGDGVCDWKDGETCKTCPQDCGCGSWTKGCYGYPNIPGFTDSHGCMLRYKEYEENCTMNEECDPMKGLVCIKSASNAVGHCCKPGEFWDPNTPAGFLDANTSIKGTCRVPRGVKIEYVQIKELSDRDIVWSACGEYTEWVPRMQVSVKVLNLNPKGEKVCVLFADEPDHCCNNFGSSAYSGGGRIECATFTGEHTFYFTIADRAPHIGWNIISSSPERACRANGKMIVMAFIPFEKYDISNINSEYRDLIYNSTLYNEFWNNFLNFTSGCDAFGYCPANGKFDTIGSYSAVFGVYDGNGGYTYSSGIENVDVVNGHPGNILADKNEVYDWADLVVFYTTSTSYDKCGSSSSALGKGILKAVEYTPTSEYPIPFGSYSGQFICGGGSFW